MAALKDREIEIQRHREKEREKQSLSEEAHVLLAKSDFGALPLSEFFYHK